jgi:N,N'-diacetyllegionaminate synthase
MGSEIFRVNHRKIGRDQPCFVIAEAGVNHNGKVDTAQQMIRAAACAGADAVKFQTFKADRLTSSFAPKAEYQKKNTVESESQLEMLRKLELPEVAYPILIQECRANNIIFMSSPFDEESADMLDALGMVIFKIPSGEITNLPFLTHIAKKKKPIILSTGMSYLSEVEIAVNTILESGNKELALLHCTSNYPAKPEGINLRAMNTLAEAFHLQVGLSDHSEGIEIALAAVAMGATIIEKHFTLDRNMSGPDQRASLEPSELESMIKGIRKVELALGHTRKEPSEGEAETAAVARKSIVARIDIPAGSRLTESHLAIMRPGTGLPPTVLPTLLGRTARANIPKGTLISLEMLE